MKTTIVIPLSSRARDGLDLQRFEHVLYPSLHRHIRGSDLVQDVIVICRDIDRRKIPHVGEPLMRIVTDEELLGPLDAIYRNPWLKQQALKLLVHAKVETDTYLVLDADCFAVKDLREPDLFPEGRARLGIGKKGLRDDWWAQSALLLQHGDTRPPKWPYMGVTPQILYTRIVAGLVKELESIHQQSPREVLGRSNFTEYTLYWLYLLEVAEPESLYFMDNTRLSLLRGIWGSSQAPIAGLKRLLAEGRTCFGLVQSTLGIDPEWIAEILFEGKSHGEKTR